MATFSKIFKDDIIRRSAVAKLAAASGVSPAKINPSDSAAASGVGLANPGDAYCREFRPNYESRETSAGPWPLQVKGLMGLSPRDGRGPPPHSRYRLQFFRLVFCAPFLHHQYLYSPQRENN